MQYESRFAIGDSVKYIDKKSPRCGDICTIIAVQFTESEVRYEVDCFTDKWLSSLELEPA